jgi:hypothetical protein
MNLEYPLATLGSLRKRSKAFVIQSATRLTTVFIGCLASYIAFVVISSVDFDHLIPVDMKLVLESLPFMFLVYFIGLATVACLSGIPDRLTLFTFAFFLRAAISIALSLVFQYDDELAFHYAGIEHRHLESPWSSSGGYYWIVSNLYHIFGANLLLPKFVNSFWGSLLPFLAYDIGQRLFNNYRVARRAFLFAAFLPPLVVYSAVNLKEILTAFLLVLTLWFLIIPHRSIVQRALGVFIGVVMMYWVRGAPWAAQALIAPVAYLLFGNILRIRGVSGSNWILSVVFLGVLMFVTSPFVFRTIEETMLSRTTEESYYVQSFADSSATVSEFVDSSNPLSAKNCLVLFVRGLYSPPLLRVLFGQFHVDLIIEGVNMMVWYVLTPFAITSVVARRYEAPIITCGLTVLAVLVMATAGTMVGADPYRHRMTMMGLFSILAAGGFETEQLHGRRWVFYLWWTGAVLFSIAWLMFNQ